MNTTMNADHSKMRNPVGVPCWRGMLGCSPLPQTREVRSDHQGRFAMAHQPFTMLRCAFGARRFRTAEWNPDRLLNVRCALETNGYRSPKGFRIIAKGCRALARLPWNAEAPPDFDFTEPQRGSAPDSHATFASIPNIPFIPLDALLSQHHAVFILERFRPVMLGLMANVINHCICVRLAHGKRTIARLPMKHGKLRPFLADPDRGGTFHFLHPICQRGRATDPRQNVNVIRNAANGDGRTIQLSRNSPEVGVHRIHFVHVREPRVTVLGRKHEMNNHVGKRLRHKTNLTVSRLSQLQIREADAEPRWGSSLNRRMFAPLSRGASLRLGAPSLCCGVPLAHEELKPKAWQWDRDSSFCALREHQKLKPKGLPHHSEGLVSLSEPTLESIGQKSTYHRANPNGVPHL
jgi:hypothetical protein